MKKALQLLMCIPIGIAFISLNLTANAQSFKKGKWLLSLSGGSTEANYTTRDLSRNYSPIKHKRNIEGIRDPLSIEYGLTNKWGIGLSSGADIFTINPNQYYGFKLPGDATVEVLTSEFTFDANYHFLVSNKIDLSAFSSVGLFSLAFEGNASDYLYKHESKGAIIRVGTKGRYYFWKRLGVMGMFSLYSGNASPLGVKTNTVAERISTTITGKALEFGLCFRFF